MISFFDLSLPIYYGEQLPLWTSFNIPAKPALEVAIDQNSDRYLHIPLKFSLTAFKSQTDRQHWTVGWSSKADIFHATKISRACKVDRAPNNSRAPVRLIQIYDFISLNAWVTNHWRIKEELFFSAYPKGYVNRNCFTPWVCVL